MAPRRFRHPLMPPSQYQSQEVANQQHQIPGNPRLERTLQLLHPRTPRLRHQLPTPNPRQTRHRPLHPGSPTNHPLPHPHPPHLLDRPRPRRAHRPPPPHLPHPTLQPPRRSPNRHSPHPSPMAVLLQPCRRHGLLPLAFPRHHPRT